MIIIKAQPQHCEDIARLIMTAMTDECCQNIAGEKHNIDDFHKMMLELVRMDDSQYSWRNAFVALDEKATDGDVDKAPVAGAIVGYDGKDLHRLRLRFQEAAKKHLEMDYSQMDDETQEGEFYLDSLAVYSAYRRQGIASMLLDRMIRHAASLNLPAALLVDKNNPNAERLYTSLGFRYQNDAMWGGHEMKHLVVESYD